MHPDRPLETKIVRRIEEIPAQDWESVYPKVVEGYRFFKALDDANFQQFSFYYIIIYRDGKPAAAATCFLMSYYFDTTVQGRVKTVVSYLKKLFPRLFQLKTLMCGSPVGPGRMGILQNSPELFEAIQRAVDSIAKKEKVALIVFKEFDPSYRDLLGALAKHGFHRFDSFPSTKQEIHYKTFQEYLSSLSYKTRYDLKRKFKKVDGHVPIDLEITNDLGGALDEAYGLYRQVLARHPVEFEILPKEYFVSMTRQMPQEATYFLWRIRGKLVAFCFCLVADGYFLDSYLGLDYEVAYEYHLYFIRFRDMMNWCLKNGIRIYDMSTGNYDPKKRLGFQLIPQDNYAKLRNRLLNPLLKFGCHFLEPQRTDPALKRLAGSSN